MPSLEFATLLESFPADSADQPFVAFAYPGVKASFWAWTGLFALATARLTVPIFITVAVQKAHTDTTSTLLIWATASLFFWIPVIFLMVFSWLLSVIQIGFSLAQFTKPLPLSGAPCIGVLYRDLRENIITNQRLTTRSK